MIRIPRTPPRRSADRSADRPGGAARRTAAAFRRTARAMAYLLLGLVTGTAALAAVVAAVTVCAVLGVTHLGPHAFRTATAVLRFLAGRERRRAALVLPAPVSVPYRTGDATAARARDLARRPATRRDAAWLTLLFPLAVTTATVAVTGCAVVLAAATAPAWAWALPAGLLEDPGFRTVTTPGGRLLTALGGLVCLPAAALLVRGPAVLQARLAASLLAPGRTQRLAERADRLAVTRRRAVDAQAAELRRIERDLHDGAQARIVSLGMTLALAERRLRPPGADVAGARADLAAARDGVTAALNELRHLVRGIHPPILTDRGLDGALAALVADHPLPVSADVRLPHRLAPAVEAAAYFTIAEALTNAAKHARATRGSLTVRVHRGGALTVTVTDDGRGGADPAGSGLTGLRRRVEALDGVLVLTSPAGGPTRVHVEFPCAS